MTLGTATMSATDVTGSWSTAMKTPDGQSFPLTFTFKQDGVTLTGTVQGPQGDPIAISNGKIDGNNLSWSAKITSPLPLTLDFAGTVDGDKLSGSVKAGSFGSFPFTGNRSA